MDKYKKANLIRVAEARTNRILDGLVLLGNLSRYSYYEYTPAQINKIFTAIEEETQRQKQILLIILANKYHINNRFSEAFLQR